MNQRHGRAVLWGQPTFAATLAERERALGIGDATAPTDAPPPDAPDAPPSEPIAEMDMEPDAEPVITTQPAQLSAADFPAAMTADVLQAATSPPVQPSGPPATISPARTRASSPQPGSSPAR